MAVALSILVVQDLAQDGIGLRGRDLASSARPPVAKPTPFDYHLTVTTIGVLAGWQLYRTATNLSYLLPVLDGINRAAQDLGCNLLLGCGIGASGSPDDPPRPAWPLPATDVDFVPIGSWNTQGLIIFTPLHSQQRTQYVHELIAAGQPVLFVGTGESGQTIAADNHAGVSQAIAHLVEHGHRRIAFIAGSQDDLSGDSGERLTAYKAAINAHGLEFDDRLVAFGQHVYSGGQSAIREILRSGRAFTAVLASNDESALGAMQALKEAGRLIPDDVAVIGFDNRLEGAAEKPSLSSIHVPLFDLGYRAVESILDLINIKAGLPGIIRVPTRLLARESCGCASLDVLDASDGSAAMPPEGEQSEAQARFLDGLAAAVMNEAHHLEAKKCHDCCRRLADAYVISVRQAERSALLVTLADILQHTVSEDDDAHIWQRAISLIASKVKATYPADSPSARLADEILNRARLLIGATSLRQHRQYVSKQRQTSRGLSLLTAALQTVLDEAQVFGQLAQHLPALGIDLAWLTLFESDPSDPNGWSTIRDVLAPNREPVRLRTNNFAPDTLLPADKPFHLALIPLVNLTGQLGYLVFGTGRLDVYGAIVEQVGGALNAARLYREATEGRRLAEESDRLKSRFLSTISHELRTPLNLIVGLSGMVLRTSEEGEMLLPAPTQQDVERIHAYSLHLGGLIGDVLDLATSDAGQLRLNNDFIELGQVLRITADSGRQMAADKGLTWEVDLPESGPWIWGDATRLRQVALNLIGNAIKYTERGGVSLRLQVGSDVAVVTVSDTGLGIAHDEQEAIFDEFHRAERTVNQGYAGMGLGLSISKRLVEMHGGSIGVRSSGENGAGSAFYFSLPVIQPSEVSAKHRAKTTEGKQSMWVLTTHPASSVGFCERLRERGFEVQVIPAESLPNWQTGQAQPKPDAILLDVQLASDLSGKVLTTLKQSELTREAPVVFYELSAERGAVMELDFLTKPIGPAEMIQALDEQWLLHNADAPEKIILIVDDDAQTVDMHARMVQSHSARHRIRKAYNGHEALALLRQERVDLVLLDLNMPEPDGFAVLDAMRAAELNRYTPVIVVTGQTLTQPAMQRLTQGVATVLSKGLFSVDETLSHVEAALGRLRKRGSQAQRLARQAMAYIHEHYAEQITRESLARLLAVNEDYLTLCFRKEVGMTPIAYLNRYRVNQAKDLLANSAQSITEIAMTVGFSDSGYFSRVFRQKAGVSPEAYRQTLVSKLF